VLAGCFIYDTLPNMKHLKFATSVIVYGLIFRLASLIRLDWFFVIMGVYAFTVTVVLLWILTYKNKGFHETEHVWGSHVDAGDSIIDRTTIAGRGSSPTSPTDCP
jgi:hypothetical protein